MTLRDRDVGAYTNNNNIIIYNTHSECDGLYPRRTYLNLSIIILKSRCVVYTKLHSRAPVAISGGEVAGREGSKSVKKLFKK